MKKKLSLRLRTTIWFLIILFIAIVLYGTLLFAVFRFNIAGERHLAPLRDNPQFEKNFVEEIEQFNKEDKNPRFLPPLMVFASPTMWKIIYSVSGGVLLIIIISVSGGFLYTRKMLQNIDTITKNVQEIDERRLHLRLNLNGKDVISKMAKTFDQMLDKIENSFNKQKNLIQNVSHELNTPLTIIKTNIDVLEQNKSATKKDYQELIHLINNEVKRLTMMTDDLLLFSTMNGQKFSKVNMVPIIENLLKLFSNRMQSKEINVIKDFQKGNHEVLGIHGMIEQLLFNLFDNAIKYSPSGGEVILKLYDNNNKGDVIFEIANDNMILGEEDISKIFERFFKIDNSSSQDTSSSYGLGLTICKKIVESHNGTISAELIADGKKINFKVVLPSK